MAIADELVAISIVVLGIVYLWKLKVRTRETIPMDTFRTFFAGGGRVGERLTEAGNWGLCFAFANSIWYYAYLGYYYGLYVFLLQAAWSLAVVVMAIHLRKYLSASHSGTVHGFIAVRYGARASILAACATLLGYTLNIGFEVFYSAHLFATIFDAVAYELLLGLAFAAFVGGYSAIGGYMANVATDRLQNILGVISLLILATLVLSPLYASGHLRDLLTVPAENSWPSLSFIVGVIAFSFFFNLVDMANWQSMAANARFKEQEELAGIRNGFFKSATVQMLAPAFLGSLVGAALKLDKSGLADDGYFAFILHPHIAGMNLVSGILLGFLLLGFFAVTISSAGAYLVAAMQALALDVLKRREAESLHQNITQEDRERIESRVLTWVKQWMVPVIVGMTICFALLYYGLTYVQKQAVAFQFQFVMYGAAVTLVPSVITALWHPRRLSEQTAQYGRGFWSIFVGLVFVIGPFAFAELGWSAIANASIIKALKVSPDDVVNLTPLFGLVTATVVFFGLSGKANER